MKKFFLPLVFGMLTFTLQTTLVTSLPIHRVRPDIVLIFTLYLGLFFPPVSGGLLAFFMGYLMDLFSGNTYGLYTFSRSLLFTVAYLFRNRFYLEGIPSQFFFVFILALGEGFLLQLLLTALNPSPLYPLLLTVLLPQTFSTALITPLFFALLRKGLFFAPKTGWGAEGGFKL
ncbi:MAG: rod shape-determining protein MreD [Deltaproteobacteria bacterium RBG_16_50_11]|nr:MAG: rod shape-determining protein MreD [Deltaproteobacteria bacterium RBG_16_50_11]